MNPGLEGVEPMSEQDGNDAPDYVGRVLVGPGISLLLMVVVSFAAWSVGLEENVGLFVLHPPISEGWWQLPLSVFTHSGQAHLIANATSLMIFGSLVAIWSGPLRYHVFFLTTGVLAGVSQVVMVMVLGGSSGVVGASGATLALTGYVFTSNAISSWVLERFSAVTIGVIAGIVAVGLAVQSAGTGVANIAHVTGALLGLVAGHYNLLRA